MDIRLQTHLVIRKDNEFLQGWSGLLNEMLWSTSPWDAWRTRNRNDADRVLRISGGELMLFNPVAGMLKKL